MGHPEALKEGGNQAKVKGSLGSPKIAHMCGSNNCCRG